MVLKMSSRSAFGLTILPPFVGIPLIGANRLEQQNYKYACLVKAHAANTARLALLSSPTRMLCSLQQALPSDSIKRFLQNNLLRKAQFSCCTFTLCQLLLLQELHLIFNAACIGALHSCALPRVTLTT